MNYWRASEGLKQNSQTSCSETVSSANSISNAIGSYLNIPQNLRRSKPE